MSAAPLSVKAELHDFKPASPNDSRAPCPALNALANHGYISRDGTDLTFFEVVNAIVLVYNLSYPLACLVAFAGFITCGRMSFHAKPSQKPLASHSWRYLRFLPCALLLNYFPFLPRFVIDLSSLSRRGYFKIAHDASFVHPDLVPSTAPSPKLLKKLLSYAPTRRNLDQKDRDGLSLIDIAQFHAERVQSTPTSLSPVHLQIALGECALAWEVLRGQQCDYNPVNEEHDREAYVSKERVDGVVPVSRLAQWFGEERLPDGWWDAGGVRPKNPIGLFRARATAKFISILAQKTAESGAKEE
ncbi:hypothetical protein GALMADRAFT_94692 [Galerina marginata CBS 339.88]|uniref:Heme haloperoxidase family profile domain-containing protein n=1 Tax=Galerina marginata (strain CBS 339.88) TaxID=685588 RepID=A0A067T4V3_GALM3|nr:hypothetical protein GALMADRAFT_94692 [Galerina marginata CBS 339.88]